MTDTARNARLRALAKDETAFQELLELVESLEVARAAADRNLQLLEATIRHDYDSICITELEMEQPGPRIVYVNEGFTRLTGWKPEEVIGKTPRILQGPKTDRAVLDKLKECLRNGKSFFGQAVNYRKDGSEFINQWDIHPLQDSQGRITHWVSYQHDISARKRSELAVLDSNILNTDDLYEQSKKCLVDFNEHGLVVGANQQFRELTGHPAEVLRTKHLWDLVVERQGRTLRNQWSRIWNDDLSRERSIRVVLKRVGGTTVQAEIQALKTRDESGRAVVRAEVRNLTLRKKVLQSLRKSSDLFNRMFDRKADFSYGLVLDADQSPRFKWVGEGFERVTGFAPTECLNRDGFLKLVHPEDQARVREHVQAVMAGNTDTLSYRIRTKDGGYMTLLDYAKPDGDGGLIATALTSDAQA